MKLGLGEMISTSRTALSDSLTVLRNQREVQGPVLRIRTRRREFALTFDDGPDPVNTPPLLGMLADCAARATFFVLGTRVNNHPTVLREIVDGGHEIALHGAGHAHLSGVDESALGEQLASLRDQVQAATQRPVSWFRAPYGFYTPASLRVCRELSLTPVTANRDSLDWSGVGRSAQQRAGSRLPRAGNIVLLHDSMAGRDDLADRGLAAGVSSPAVLEAIIAGYQQRGLQSVTLTELAHGGRPLYATC